MLGDDPPYLSVGTEVSAKYKGAFCEAKIRKVVRSVKCRVTYKQGLGTTTATDDQIKGTLRVGAAVEAWHSDRKEFVEATITKIQDCSQYTVVFDDGDITTLRRTALCLKSGRHFAESETLDQLPLTHPEHFGNPVIGGRRGRRSRQAQDDSSEDEDGSPQGNRDSNSVDGGKEDMETEPEIGRVVCVELGVGDKKKNKKDNWVPGLVVAPTAQATGRIRVRDEYLVRSFKDARYYTVPKKEATEFTKELVNKVESSTLKVAVEKALLFLEKNELPPHWDRDSLFGHNVSSGNSDSDAELDSDSSDDEPREEKDHFVAQLYKFMDDRGTPINNCPMIGSEDIDLYRLFRAVYKLGGYNRVTNQNQWKLITRRLSFTMQNSTSTHNLVKQAYKKFLHSFEDFYRKLGCTMVNHPRGSTCKQRPGRSLIRDKDRNTPVPPQTQLPKSEKEEDEKKIVDDEKKEKKEIKEIKKDQPKDEEPVKIRKKEDFDEIISGPESDVNIEAEGESSSSEKSHKAAPQLIILPTKAKSKCKDDPKKKVTEKKRNDNKKQDKKDEKVKEDDTTKTRSKSKDDLFKAKASTEARETRTPSRESDKKTVNKQRRLTDEELKKRGRKRKEYEPEKLRTDEQSAESAPTYKGLVELGDRLKVYYGPTHESKVTYEAKVIDIEKDGAEPMYLVHYTGWNTRYDEWIKASRIAQNFTQAQSRVKRVKATPRPQTPSTNLSISTNKTTKASSNATSNTSQTRRRAQSVVPVTTVSSTSSSKEGKKDEKDTVQPARSTTPLSVVSSSSRTKSPATPANNRQTRVTRNIDLTGVELRRRTRRMSGHTDISIASESEDSETYESDATEPEQQKSKTRGSEERKRRDTRCRTEDRIKSDEISDGDDEKDNLEEPRRGRRLRRVLGKSQGIKSEPDSDEEQPKGRDFDLNQIRSELKGFDKAVKLELSRSESDLIDEFKPGEKETMVLISPKVEKGIISPTAESIPDPKPVDNTEDIYEFKEPEPFEFEVRNKKDINAEKDKVKKRVFEEEPKSPKKKPKTVVPSISKDIKVEADNDCRKKTRKLFGKKAEDITEPSCSNKLAVSTSDEAFDKLCESPSISQMKPIQTGEEPGKMSNSLDLLFSDLPGDDDVTRDDSEDRLIISETEVSEAEQENLFTYQQEIFTSNELVDTIEIENVNKRPDPDPQAEDTRLGTAVTTTVNKNNTIADQKQNNKCLSLLPKASPPLRTLDTKLLDVAPITTSILATPAPISARLPATSTIEEKLSAAMAFRKSKELKKEEESNEQTRRPIKESFKKLDVVVVQRNREEQSNLKTEVQEKQEKEGSINEGEQHNEILQIAVKEKEDELQQPKIINESDLKKYGDAKVLTDSRKPQESRNEDWKTRCREECRLQEEQNVEDDKESEKEQRKKFVNQEIADSTDSSDSEQRLIIDNDDCPDVKDTSLVFDVKMKSEVDRFQDMLGRSSKTLTQKSVQSLSLSQPSCLSEFKSEAVSSMKTDEEGETLTSLLCEEEIPGSPAPASENVDQGGSGTSNSPPKTEAAENSIALMEIPFASAPTSGQNTTSSTVSTLSIALPKAGDISVPLSVPIQQNVLPNRQQSQAHQHISAVMPAQRRESNEAAPVMDNTPPTTPDSSISNISESPREERTGGSSPASEDNIKTNRDSSELDNDSGGKGPGYSEDDTLNHDGNIDRTLKPPAKRSVDDGQSPKKRKRSRKHSECSSSVGKKPGKQHNRHSRHGAGSDSDDTSEGSNLCGLNSTTSSTTHTGSVADLSNYSSSRSPRPTKYNFYVELDPELDGSQRIAVLQQKLAELRKTYNAVKVELAAIERRRKKLRRREREAMKAAKAEMQQACS